MKSDRTPEPEKKPEEEVDSAGCAPTAGSAIPPEVAVCPECGGRLTLMENFDLDGEDPPSMDCENEPEIDSDEWDHHRWWQSEWQPVIDKVSAHLRGQNDEVELPPKGSSDFKKNASGG